jgi:Zn-dependent peptidase ImmA (M78 family)/DNA-binding XRE family transcriptional regulator
MNTSGVESFTPSRLVLARDRRGISQRRLADLVGVTDRSIRLYEAGTHPTVETLHRIASVLGFPIGFFQASPVEPLSLEAASFRALSKASAGLRHRAVAAGTIALDLQRYLSERFDLPQCDLPDLRDVEPKRAAEAVRHLWGLGQQPIPNMVHLMELHGVRVFSLSEDCDSIDAFSIWRDGTPFVFLNSRKTAERSIFDAAHELGHLVLHRHGSPAGREGEREADKFASNLLMPEAAMLAAAPRMPTIASITAMKLRWRASVSALGFRLHELNRMTEWQYRHFNIELARRGKENEPAPLARETSAIAKKAFEALAGEGTAIRDVARDLHLPVGEVRALTFALHAIEESGAGSSPPRAKGKLKLVRG